MLKVPLVSLGDTDLKVSKLGISTFASEAPSLSSEEEGGRILIESHKLGVNFWDTSDDYGTYPHIAYALKSVPRKEVVISTKTYAKSGQEAKKSLKEFFERVNTDYLDIFLLHFVKSNWIDGAHRMLRELNDIKATGIVKAIGLSTHSVIVVKEASKFKELDVIMAICCKVKQAAINKFPRAHST